MTERGAKHLTLFLVIGESLITMIAYSYYRLCAAVGFSMAESIASGVLWWLFLTLCWVIIIWPREIYVEPKKGS